MKDAYEAVSGGVGRFVQSWFMPSLIMIGLVAFLLFPAVDEMEPFTRIGGLSGAERAGLILLLALTLALLLSSSSTPLYRVLEGYRLPSKWADRKRNEHKAARTKLRDDIAQMEQDDAIRIGIAHEELDRYPRASKYVMPTRLGNALKAGETYGRTQYNLDTVLLWNQLVSVADDELKEALTRTRTMMDFHAGVFWLSPLFALASIGTAIYAKEAAYLLGLIALVVCPGAYSATVRAATLYASVLRALVDTTRVDLAKKLGLQLPTSLADERELWGAYSEFAAWGDKWSGADTWITTIDKARAAPEPQDQHEAR